MSDEEDFMSDAFLVDATTQKKESETYSQKRKRAQAHAYERGLNKSAKARQEEARKTGLSQSLLESKNPPNKALAMMQKMGYQAGSSLGKASSSSLSPPSTTTTTTTNTSTTIKPARIDPIAIELREGRKGIGSTTINKNEKQQIKEQESATVSKDEFMERSRKEFECRKAQGQLNKARRTCQSLDEAKGITTNIMWLDPIEEEAKEEEKRSKLLESQGHGGSYDEEEDSDADDYNPELRDEVVDEEDGLTTKESWLNMDAPTRLEKTLHYLREKHLYCFWCGSKFDNKKELDQTCPGLNEDDH